MYYENIINPISLNDIKQRYISGAYKSLVDVLKDIKTVFTNGKLYFCVSIIDIQILNVYSSRPKKLRTAAIYIKNTHSIFNAKN